MSKKQTPADPLAADFRNFLFVVWKHLNLPPPTKRQYEIAEFLQHGPKRKMIQGFRGVAKSWITCAYVCWLLYGNPQKNILVISASKPKADEFTTFTKRLITEVPCLQHLGLNPANKDQRWSTISFDVAPAEADPNPSVKSAGITGQITGSRADEIIADDVETLDNALTPMMREKLNAKITEFDAILKPEGETKITFLGTPQTVNTIYKDLPSKGYTVRIWPARYPDAGLRSRFGHMLAPGIAAELEANPKLVGKSTEPTRFSDIDLAGREASMRSRFQLQYMLDPTLSEAGRYPLKLRDLIVTWLDNEQAPERFIWAASPEWELKDTPMVGLDGDRFFRPVPLNDAKYLSYTGSVMVIDPAGRGQDETAYAVVKCLNGFLFLMDAGGFPPGQGYADRTLQELADTAARFKVNKIIIEANFGDGMFTKVFQPYLLKKHPCGIEEVKHSTRKEQRICDTLEPVLNSHRLVMSQALIAKDFESTAAYSSERAAEYQLFYQLTHISREKGCLSHDDRVDAVAIAVGYFASAMAADNEQKVQDARDRLMQEELERFMDHALGKRTNREPVFGDARHVDYQ